MSNVYLNRIRLEQYRTFKTLDIGLPDGPGVLVVHGSNGIGKSSMFDGLEWALTDKIDHFRDADGVKKVGSYLCRWRQGAPGPTSVTLDFSGGNSVSRTLSSSRATKSTVAGTIPNITEFLRDDGWDRDISELSSYLLLTHFLGQSTKSRLTNREPGERFDILKEAAQSKQVEEIAKALHGKGNTKASRAFTDRIDDLNKEVTALRNLLETESSLWSGLTSVIPSTMVILKARFRKASMAVARSCSGTVATGSRRVTKALNRHWPKEISSSRWRGSVCMAALCWCGCAMTAMAASAPIGC